VGGIDSEPKETFDISQSSLTTSLFNLTPQDFSFLNNSWYCQVTSNMTASLLLHKFLLEYMNIVRFNQGSSEGKARLFVQFNSDFPLKSCWASSTLS